MHAERRETNISLLFCKKISETTLRTPKISSKNLKKLTCKDVCNNICKKWVFIENVRLWGNSQQKQFSPEERNVICITNEKRKGKFSTYKLVIDEFSAKFPQSISRTNQYSLNFSVDSYYSEISLQVFDFIIVVLDGNL